MDPDTAGPSPKRSADLHTGTLLDLEVGTTTAIQSGGGRRVNEKSRDDEVDLEVGEDRKSENGLDIAPGPVVAGEVVAEEAAEGEAVGKGQGQEVAGEAVEKSRGEEVESQGELQETAVEKGVQVRNRFRAKLRSSRLRANCFPTSSNKQRPLRLLPAHLTLLKIRKCRLIHVSNLCQSVVC